MLDSQPHRRSLRPFYLVAYAAVIGTSMVTAVLLWTLSWNAPLNATVPEPIFAIGPLAPGGSVEQQFEGEGTYLTGLEFFIQADSARELPVALVIRLYEAGSLLRQGNLDAVVGPDIASARWDFAPISDVEGRRLSLQIVVGDSVQTPIYVMASLTDLLPGGAVTNGIPTGDHIGVAIRPWRTVQRTDVIRVVVSSFPVGVPGIVVAISVLALVVGYFFAKLTPRHGSRVWRHHSPYLLGLSVTLLVLAVRFHRAGSRILPELEAEFWGEWARIMVLTGIAVWLLALGGQFSRFLHDKYLAPYITAHFSMPRVGVKKHLGGVASRMIMYRAASRMMIKYWADILQDIYLDVRRLFGGNREILLAVAVFFAITLTLIALAAHILEGPNARHVGIPVLKDHIPFAGNFDVLERIHTVRLPKMAGIAWSVVAIGSLLLRLTRRDSTQSP